jgi:anti-sigma-K factor RskA
MTMDDEREGMAAEYALGTLDADERAQADALVLVDPEFAALVRFWERRLGELNVLVAPVEPPDPVWEKIRAGVMEAAPGEPMRLPEIPAPPVQAIPEPQQSAEIFYLTQRAQRWRGFGILSGLVAACVVGIFLVRDYRPDMLPPELRPKQQVVVVEKPVEAPARAVQFVAVFQKDEQSPAFLMSVDIDKRTISVRQVAAEKLTDKSYQLWIAPRPGEGPHPLGVLPNDETGVKATLAAYDPSVINGATFGISLEPFGGSPTGKPTGPVIHAKLLEVPNP